MIKLAGVGKTVSTRNVDVEILKEIDLSVGEGEMVAVVGPSGSGKSTLMNVVGLLDQPSQGRYEIDGREVAGLTSSERDALRSQVFGFVFQAFHLMETRSVIDNVKVGLLHAGIPRRERRSRAADALEAVGLGPRSDFVAGTLSGGEKQRVAIARALAGSKRVLLCDEPTGSLDSKSGRAIIDLLEQLHESGLTMIVVSHDPEVARRCRRVVEIQDGQVLDQSSG